LRDHVPAVRARGAELVVVGNGAQHFAAAFREDLRLDAPVLIDPELRAYRAAGMRRGRVEMLSPRLPRNALRALRAGHRQTAVQGDPWQLGGVLVIRPGGALAYRFASREAGDHAPVHEILAALEPDAPVVRERSEPPAAARWVGRGLSALVDPGVVFSFDRTGFAIHALAFDPDDLDVDLAGRRCLVTGANSGIGYETSLALADLGADVVLLCRDRARGDAAAERIRAQTGSRRVSVETLDVASLASVRAAAERLAADPVHVLVHNAGVLPAERVVTAEGLELCFATHVAGPHLLTSLLRPALARAGGARVVWVSSGGMYTRGLQLDDPQWRTRRERYDGVAAYAETKRAQVVLAELWAEALADAGVAVNSMHPGWADTPAVRSSIPGFWRVTRRILRTPAEGADTVVWLAASPRAGALTGRFVFDRVPRRTHWLPGTRESAADRRRLWQLVERATAPRRPRRGSEAARTRTGRRNDA
jgi:NAD(P)-dependent dehydrogenase (short-subunit alcohol dehydrogenase family)